MPLTPVVVAHKQKYQEYAMLNIIEITSVDNDTIYITYATMQVVMQLADDTELHFCVKNPAYEDDNSLPKTIDKVIALSKVKPAIIAKLTDEFNRYCNYLVMAKNTEIVEEE